MKKKNFNDFATQKITKNEQQEIVGGNQITIFCEWYISVTGNNTNPYIMSIMMMFDQGLTNMYNDWAASNGG